ncbi:hypothetical protein [Tritonibacter horizontis]|uniref:hypothetical protein n=1 Tax=Tritonibacter horizontis TaxID=1768241 RepID=UPI0013F4F130|nr:hypothetical protein [Tritonibacter horizontis]
MNTTSANRTRQEIVRDRDTIRLGGGRLGGAGGGEPFGSTGFGSTGAVMAQQYD